MKLLCPFCFEEIKSKDVEFRCANMMPPDSSNGCALVDDEKLSIYQGRNNVAKGRNFFAGGSLLSFPKKATCPACKTVSNDRICPHCHNTLPQFFGETENYTLAVLGAKATGKSHYIGVLIDYIGRMLSQNFNFAISAANDSTATRYENNYRSRIYDQHATIDATQSGKANADIKEPLLYEIKFHNEKNRVVKTVTFAFFDTAGEDLNSEDIMATVNKYIFKASGIILLVDPLQLTGVRNQLQGVNLPTINAETLTIVDRVVRLIKKANGLGPGDQIKTPIAVAFTKADAIQTILPANSVLKLDNKSPHFNLGGLDVNDCENVSSEMAALLSKYEGGGFLKNIESNFRTYSYFGISALGCNPEGTKKIDNVVPYRIEDPFLWLLWQAHLVDGYQ